MREITSGLLFPEGPIAMLDGSVILVEIARGTLSRVTADGKIEVIAETGGGPNGAALGPDGAVYICNNGGFEWHNVNGLLFAGDIAEDYSGGRIERVDLTTGKVDVLYTEVNGHPLRGPNDIVFDRQGCFWFTDLGKGHGRLKDRGALFYAKTDGSHVEEMVFPVETANGVGLSPDEDYVYVAETQGARLWRWQLDGPGKLADSGRTGQKNFVASPAGYSFFDSMAVEADGTVCVATIINGGISRINPQTGDIAHIPTGDPMTTNICFGGDDLKTAYITASGTGRLLATDWDTPGLPLNFLNR
jgi:gluconolactonase